MEMGILLILAVFIGYSSLIHNKLKINSAFIPIMIITTITCIVFIFGIVNKLNIAVNSITIIGLLFFAYYIIQTLRKRFSMEFFLSPAMVFFIIGSAYCMFLLKDVSYLHYDNFSHFGKIVKEMFYSNSYPNSNTTITFQNYPPATATFIYYFCKVIGYSEGYTLVGQSVLIMGALATFLWKSNFKNILFNFLTIAVIFITLSILTLDNTTLHIYNLLVDGILGFLTSAAIVVAYYYRNDIKKNFYINLPLLVFLVLTKDSGKLFFFIVILFVLLSNTQIRVKIKNIKQLKIIIPLILILIVIPLLFSNLWKGYVVRAYSTEAYQSNKFVVSENKLTENFNLRSEEFKKTLHIKIIKKVLDIHSINTQLFICINLASILISLAYYVFKKKKAKLQLKALVLSDFMMALYVIGEYLMYLLIMPEGEATDLASFDRYISSAIIVCVCTQLICGANTINKIFESINYKERISGENNIYSKGKYLFNKAIIPILCCIIVVPNFYAVREGIKQLCIKPNEENFRRVHVQKACEIARSYLGRNESILIYNGEKDNGTGFYYYLGTYEMLTNNIDILDVNMINTNNNKFISLLSQRDYIIMAENDVNFWDELAKNNISYAGTKDGILYKIIHANEQTSIEKII